MVITFNSSRSTFRAVCLSDTNVCTFISCEQSKVPFEWLKTKMQYCMRFRCDVQQGV